MTVPFVVWLALGWISVFGAACLSFSLGAALWSRLHPRPAPILVRAESIDAMYRVAPRNR